MSELKSGLFFLGLSLFVISMSFRFDIGALDSPGAGFLPLCAGITMAVLSVIQIFKSWAIRKSGKLRSHHLAAFLVILAMLAYSLALEPLGFILATFFVVGILLRLTARRPWWTLLWASALSTCAAYVLFRILLHIYFPRGFIEMLLGA